MSTLVVIVVWLATCEGLTLAAWPLLSRALPNSVDRGWAASRVASLLLVSLGTQIAVSAHIVTFEQMPLLALIVVGAVLVWGGCRQDLRGARFSKQMLIAEGVFLGAFALAVGMRVLLPSVDNNERPMDYMFLDAFLHSRTLPPLDPWFAGEPISYYTLGYLGWATVIRLSAVPVEVGYNLAVASVFATAAAAVWATAASARTRLLDGTMAVIAFGLVGNLRTLVDWLITFGVGSAQWWASWSTSVAVTAPDPGWLLWLQASRVIPNLEYGGITEFPYLSLVVGDLHPHFMAMGANILAIAIALGGFRGGPLRLLVPLGAATVAGLAAANTWNVPGAIIVLGAGLGSRYLWPRLRCRQACFVLTGFLGLVALLSAALLKGTTPPPLSLALTPQSERLWPGTFAVLYLPLLFGVAAVVLARVSRWPVWLGGLCVCATAAALAEVVAGASTLVVTGALALAVSTLAVRALRRGAHTEAALLTTCAVGIGLICAPEVVFLNDYFGNRVNTVFKAYYQALLFLSVGLPPLLAASAPLPRSTRLHTQTFTVMRRAAIYAAVLTLLYVPLGPFTRMAVSPPGGNLDALAFLSQTAPDDLAAIQWLRTSAAPGSVILEAVGFADPIGTLRTTLGRFSAFSGQPTVVGWRQHEQQWRGRIAAIDERVDQAETVFRTDSADQARDILARYDVRYVVVGQTEHDLYGQSVDDRMKLWLEPTFRSGDTTIYRVPAPLTARSGP